MAIYHRTNPEQAPDYQLWPWQATATLSHSHSLQRPFRTKHVVGPPPAPNIGAWATTPQKATSPTQLPW
jgi:hypothetical protein